MPIQAPQWTEFLSCPICCHEFAANLRPPISLGCGHTICRTCLATLHRRQCPFDQTFITTELENLPINYALLQLVNNSSPSSTSDGEITSLSVQNLQSDDLQCYTTAKKCIEELALNLKPFSNGNSLNLLSRPMQRKLVTLINCQLIEDEGRSRALRAARSLGERTVTELILQHQNPQQLSANLWAAVRARGCQFLGPAMQEEVLKLVLLALEDGSALSRKVLVMFVVQKLEPHFTQASKTSIGHVVQLLYRASCFKVSKREGDSSLMQLKEEFRTYDALRREHDAQIVQIATEAGLRIAPDQWSALLYGDTAHKSHMQSIIDKLQTPQSFAQSVQELVIALQRTGDPAKLSGLRIHLKYLANIDPSAENSVPTWREVADALNSVRQVVIGLVEFVQHHGNRKLQEPGHANHNAKYKISMCRDLNIRGTCPRGTNCTFAHSEEELEKYRAKNRKINSRTPNAGMKDSMDYLGDSLNTSGSSHSFIPSEETSPMRFPQKQQQQQQQQMSVNMMTQPQQYNNDKVPIPPPMQNILSSPNMNQLLSTRTPFDYNNLNYPPPPPPPQPMGPQSSVSINIPPPPTQSLNIRGSGANNGGQYRKMMTPNYQQNFSATNNNQSPMYNTPNPRNFSPEIYVGSSAPLQHSMMVGNNNSTPQQRTQPSQLPQSQQVSPYQNPGKIDIHQIEMLRQTQNALWEQQQQHQSHHAGLHFKTQQAPPPTTNSNYLNSISNNRSPVNMPKTPSRCTSEMYVKDMEKAQNNFNNNNKILGPQAYGNEVNFNNNNTITNTNNNNNINKGVLLSPYWAKSQAASSFPMDTVSSTARDSFVRSDSILDDDYVPFDAPTTSSPFGPITRMKGKYSDHHSQLGLLAEATNSIPLPLSPNHRQQLANSNFNRPLWTYASANIGGGSNGNGGGVQSNLSSSDDDFIKLQAETFPSYGVKLNNFSSTLDENGYVSDYKTQPQLTNDLIDIEKENKENKIQSAASLISNHQTLAAATAALWDTSNVWDTTGGGSDRSSSSIANDTYDVNITNDMRALELRLESELEEQEKKMWSQPEISSHN